MTQKGHVRLRKRAHFGVFKKGEGAQYPSAPRFRGLCLTAFIPTHPVNFSRGRKPEHPEKTHDFRQSVDRLLSHESVARIKPTNSEVKGAGSDDCNEQCFLKLNRLISSITRLVASPADYAVCVQTLFVEYLSLVW
jgi:hypothetical protein